MKQLYYNGTIITVNDDLPQADAMIVENGKFVAVGSLEDVRKYQDHTTVEYDLAGKTVLPGFIDGHSHVANIMSGLPKIYPPPNGNVSSKTLLFNEIQRMIEQDMLLENGWFVAIGYDHTFFDDESHPTRWDLDKISTEIPILILHISGHVGVANSKALSLMKWDKHTSNPPGGIIQRETLSGELNGILEEKAVQKIGLEFALADMSMDYLTKMFFDTQKFYASNGITTAQEGGATPDSLKMLKYCQQHNKLLIDVVAYPFLELCLSEIPNDTSIQQYKNHLKIAGAKLVADGSPQAKTAWLTEPYFIPPQKMDKEYRGYPVYSDEQMKVFCLKALAHNWQLLVHCNGDAAGDQFIEAYRRAQDIAKNEQELRPVMIHAQTVREDQLDAMLELGIMPSYFHDHVYYWGDYHLSSVLGPERGARISPLRSSQDRGMKFTLHNDSPITPPTPLFNIHNAVNRKTKDGRNIGVEYTVDVMEAIRAVTINGAYQHFDEKIKGSIEVGKLADFVILDANPLSVPKDQLKNIKVLRTIKEGETIYECT